MSQGQTLHDWWLACRIAEGTRRRKRRLHWGRRLRGAGMALCVAALLAVSCGLTALLARMPVPHLVGYVLAGGLLGGGVCLCLSAVIGRS